MVAAQTFKHGRKYYKGDEVKLVDDVLSSKDIKELAVKGLIVDKLPAKKAK